MSDTVSQKMDVGSSGDTLATMAEVVIDVSDATVDDTDDIAGISAEAILMALSSGRSKGGGGCQWVVECYPVIKCGSYIAVVNQLITC